MHLSDLKSKHVSELLDIALELDVDNASRLRKQELMFAILKKLRKPANRFSVTELWKSFLTDSVSFALRFLLI